MHIFLLYILFGIPSSSYFALFVSTEPKRKPLTISVYMSTVTIKGYSILFYKNSVEEKSVKKIDIYGHQKTHNDTIVL